MNRHAITLTTADAVRRFLLVALLLITTEMRAQEVAENKPIESTLKPLQIGSKNFTESIILAELVTQLLQAHGIPAEHRQAVGGSRILWNSLLRGEIDIYPEYSGTLRHELLANVDGAKQIDLDLLLANFDLSPAIPLGFANNYALGMRAQMAENLTIRKLSDLPNHPQLKIGVSSEFLHRADGWPGLSGHYQLPQTAVGLEHELAYRGLINGDLDLIDLYTTDAEISEFDIAVVKDDLRFFPDYQALLIYRQTLIHSAPQAVTLIQRLENLLSENEIARLNYQHRIEGISTAELATRYLQQRHLIEPGSADRQSTDQTLASALMVTTLEQLRLVGSSMLLALLIALPLGITAAKNLRWGRVILAITGAIQTIPGLALLVLMIPLLGIGTLPAVAALFAYSLLPIVRNTETGIRSISAELIETATALGLSHWARLWHVELPLASRTILAGIKTAVVINIGTATLGALIGAGGYGQPILAGIRLDDTALILQGALPAAAMAFIAQGLFGWLETLLPESG